MEVLHALNIWAEKLARGRWWNIRLAFVLFALSIFCQFPHYNYLAGHLDRSEVNRHWDAVMLQRDHLLTHHTYAPEDDPSTHLEKMSYRLTVPAIARIFHLGPLGVFLLQNLLGLVLIALSLKFADRVTGDRVTALLFHGRACIHLCR